MTPDELYEPLNRLRDEYRRQMNSAATKAQEFATSDQMELVSEHSTESARKQEAFLALNRAIKAVEDYFIQAERAKSRS